jgi:L-ribulose-5-phosphate 3-epimerase
MIYTRRDTLLGALSLSCSFPLAARFHSRLKVGIMDVILGYPSSPEAFTVAKRVGFDAIQVSLGKPTGTDRLLLSDRDLQTRILQSSSVSKVAIASTYLEVMHRDCLKSAPVARTWVREAVRITKALNAGIVELAFFFKCGLDSQGDIDSTIVALRELAPVAEQSGVILGIENTLPAEDNIRILERIGSPAVKVWYDIGNSTNMGHFDVPHEIRLLGKDRICQIHIKDRVYLGRGAVDVKGCLQAIADIGYTGFCVFENAVPTGDRVADAATNLKLFREIEGSLG